MPRQRGPIWGAESEDLNATVLEWPPGEGPAEHVNESRDVALVVIDGGGELELDGEVRTIGAGEAVVIEKGSRRRVTAGPDGIRYATVHRRRGGLQISKLAR
ncbi:MAG TPA: cupin domain-containing protein [Gaiellaceae bacterium]|jgi:quercetin dioxygenase-like cupin family protein|nr:cupin domain-containing protein [Gaiellaceae bacterium]